MADSIYRVYINYRVYIKASGGDDPECQWREPQGHSELLRHANLKVTMDTYVQAVTEEKREAQNKVVKMLLPGIRRAVI